MAVGEVTRKAREALDVKNLPTLPGLTVTRLDAEDYTDSTGEPSLRVWVILDESVEVEKISGAAVGNLKSAIRKNLREHGISVFPYIFLAKQSELEDTNEE